MNTMSAFVMVLFAAVLIESVVTIIDNIKERETSWKYWASVGVGLIVSVLVAVNWDLDLFKMAGFPDGQVPYVGAILTGLILSRGSNYISDLVKQITV